MVTTEMSSSTMLKFKKSVLCVLEDHNVSKYFTGERKQGESLEPNAKSLDTDGQKDRKIETNSKPKTCNREK